jgi:alcohol dehydrogenase (cytochrome c)
VETQHLRPPVQPLLMWEPMRTHEDYKPATPLLVNRGAAYLDGRLFRGTLDGRVLAYDFKTGKRVWESGTSAFSIRVTGFR